MRVSDLFDELDILRLEQIRRKFVWTTKDGKKLKLSEISDEHLNNIIKMLEKNEEADEELRLQDTF